MPLVSITNGTLTATCDIPDTVMYKNGIIPVLIGTPDISCQELKSVLNARIVPITVISPMIYSYDDDDDDIDVGNQSGF